MLNGSQIEGDPKAHEDTITSIRFNPAGDAFVTGGTDKFAKVFSSPGLEKMASLESHTGHVLDVDWSFDGHTIVTAGSDHHVKYWNVEIGEVIRNVKRVDNQVKSVRFLSPSNDTLACAFGDNTIKFEATDYPESAGYTNVLELTPDRAHLIAGGEDGKIKVWTATSRKLVHVFEP